MQPFTSSLSVFVLGIAIVMPAPGEAIAKSEAKAADLPLSTLERQLRTGVITPEHAVEAYCSSESASKNADAFCACPEDAIRMLKERLEAEPNS